MSDFMVFNEVMIIFRGFRSQGRIQKFIEGGVLKFFCMDRKI